jgi:hypothetical protein
MIWMQANPLLGPLEGVGPENLDFFLGPPLPMALEMDVASIKNHYVPRHINNRYINS